MKMGVLLGCVARAGAGDSSWRHGFGLSLMLEWALLPRLLGIPAGGDTCWLLQSRGRRVESSCSTPVPLGPGGESGRLARLRSRLLSSKARFSDLVVTGIKTKCTFLRKLRNRKVFFFLWILYFVLHVLPVGSWRRGRKNTEDYKTSCFPDCDCLFTHLLHPRGSPSLLSLLLVC